MRVLHVVPTYLPAFRYGGPIHSVHALNKYLVRAGAEVSVYTTNIDGPGNLDVPTNQVVELDGVQVHYFSSGRGLLRRWFYAPDMRQALQEHAWDFDVVHITSVFLSASTLGAQAAQKAGVPYMISPRGSLMHSPLMKRSLYKKSIYIELLERRNLERASAIHFTTDIEMEEYKAADLPLPRAVIIPNGLDAETLSPGDPAAFRKKFNIGPDKKVVLHLGRISWKKGFDTLIPAFARVAKDVPEAQLVLVGSDDEGYMPELRKIIDVSGAADKITLIGQLEAEERSAAYQAATVFALPSYAENFAISAAEAMYFGVPVVISPTVGLAPDIEMAGAGIVVKKDAEAVAAEITRILRDSNLAGEMGRKGRVLAATLSYEKVAARFLEVYKELKA